MKSLSEKIIYINKSLQNLTIEERDLTWCGSRVIFIQRPKNGSEHYAHGLSLFKRQASAGRKEPALTVAFFLPSLE